MMWWIVKVWRYKENEMKITTRLIGVVAIAMVASLIAFSGVALA